MGTTNNLQPTTNGWNPYAPNTGTNNGQLNPYLNSSTPSTSGSFYGVSQQNNQAQQQVGNTAIDQVAKAGLNQGARSLLSDSSVGNAGASWFTSNITNPINTFGNSALGFAAPEGVGSTGALASGTIATPAENAAMFGAENVGSAGETIAGAAPAWTASTFTSALGSAGIGAGIGMLESSLFGGNPMGAEIGGAVGGFAGGAMLGASLGSIVPGLGTVVGALAGSVIGGMFGNNKPSDSTQLGQVELGNGSVNLNPAQHYSDTGSKFNQGNANLRDTTQKGASNLAQWLLANGATPNEDITKNNSSLIFKVGSRDGLSVIRENNDSGHEQQVLSNAGQDTKAFQNNVNQAVLGSYNIPDNLKAQMQNMNLNNFYSPNYNPSQMSVNNASITPVTPTVAPVNNQGRGLLQIPTQGKIP